MENYNQSSQKDENRQSSTTPNPTENDRNYDDRSNQRPGQYSADVDEDAEELEEDELDETSFPDDELDEEEDDAEQDSSATRQSNTNQRGSGYDDTQSTF